MNENIILSNEFSGLWTGRSPVRIVRLVPSLTEIFYYFGLDKYVVGVTRFCEHPEVKFPKPAKIGGTKNPSFDKIKKLNPDVIFASKEENNLADIERLSTICPVIVTDIVTIDDNLKVLEHFGIMFQKKKAASAVIKQHSSDFKKVIFADLKTAVYLIWKDPMMTVGGDTFINNMMLYAGFENLYFDATRYPEITMDKLIQDNPEYLLLSSEPYPFKEKHVEEFERMLPATKVILVDGQMFSWYGIRPLFTKKYFSSIL